MHIYQANVRTYYQQFEEQQTQSLIDQKVKEHLGQAGYPQVGAAFHQHLTAFGGQYRPPIPLPLPVRPLVLPRPAVPSSGFCLLLVFVINLYGGSIMAWSLVS